MVWGPGVVAGSDLYALNPATRVDPVLGRPDENGVQPIRAAAAGNLQMLGLPPIPGSRFNAAHDLSEMMSTRDSDPIFRWVVQQAAAELA